MAYTTTDYFYGSSGVTSLNESTVAANCHIWGLDLTHNLTGCKGNNLIVADGKCPPGTKNGDNDEYCEITQDSKDPGDTLNGGGGSNAIFGGGGPNTMNGGTGRNFFQTGPKTNTIHGGNAGDSVSATEGAGNIYLGTGSNFVYASSSGVYHIFCTGTHDEVWIASQDTASHCADVDNLNGNPSRDRPARAHHRRHRRR